MIKAGVASRDITPPQGLQLVGYPHFERKNPGAHDPLYASCIYIENGKSQIAFVSLDLLFLSKRDCLAVRDTLRKESGLAALELFVSCTHTHSGPATSSMFDSTSIEGEDPQDMPYTQSVLDKIVESVKEAYTHRFTATIGLDKGHCGKEKNVGGNRRSPEDPADPSVFVLAVKDEENNIRGCMTRYTLHPTFLHGENKLVSADYPGYIRQYLGEAYPGIFFLFTQGTSGDQSSRYFRDSQTFAEAKRVGYALGEEIQRVITNMTFRDNLDIAVQTRTTDFPVRTLPDAQKAQDDVIDRENKLQALKDANAPYAKIRSAECNLLGAQNTRSYVSHPEQIGEFLSELPAMISVISLDEFRLITCPGEMFIEFGLKVSEQSPYPNTFVLELTNGRLPGYMCTKLAYEEQGYESLTSLLTSEAGDLFAETALSMIKG